MYIDHTLSREKDSCEANDERKTGHDGIPVSESLRDKSIDKEANNFSDIGTLFSSVQSKISISIPRQNSRYSTPLATSQEPDTSHLATSPHTSY